MDSEKTILVRIKKVANLLDRFMGEVKADIDSKLGDTKNISAIQGRIILYLYRMQKEGQVFQKDVEKHFEIRASTAAIILRRMENNGLVTRTMDTADERKKTVTLTRKAVKLHPQAQAEVDAAERRVTKGLSRVELESFLRVLDKITRNIS